MADLDKDEQFYRDTESVAFPKLDDRQLAMLEPLGARRVCGRARDLQGGPARMGLTVVLRGAVEAFEARDGKEQILATGGPRDFIGDVAMLMGTAALVTVAARRKKVRSWKCRRTAPAGAGRIARGERDDRARVHHAPATVATGSRVCRAAHRGAGGFARRPSAR